MSGHRSKTHAPQVGEYVLIAFATTHIDRAGETSDHVLRFGEIVAVEDRGWAVVDSEDGCHLRCPLDRLYPADPCLDLQGLWQLPLPPAYFAAEELIRDYHSVECPVVLRWLDKAEAEAVCRRPK